MSRKPPQIIPIAWICLLLPLLSGCQEPYVTGLPPYFAWGSLNREQVDAFCYTTNKAALARCRRPGAALSGERPYAINGLGRYRASILLPVHHGAIGIQAGFVSAAPYREMMIATSYGLPLGHLLDAGIQLGYAQTAVPGYRPQSVVLAEAGLIMHLTRTVSAGWNISAPYIHQNEAKGGPSLRYTMGISYDPSGPWSAAMELGKGPQSGLNASLGFVYKPHRLVTVKMGFTTGGPPLWFGCGYQLKFFELNLAMALHDKLGISPAFGMLRTFNGKS